jgi:hypothetical protein
MFCDGMVESIIDSFIRVNCGMAPVLMALPADKQAHLQHSEARGLWHYLL